MPIKKPNAKGEQSSSEPCMLQFGKNNNVVQWQEEMHTHVSSLYGLTANFFMTNTRHVPPIPQEADYVPQTEEGEDDLPALPAALIAKLRDGAYEGRRKAIAKQKADETTVWPIMWERMSIGSQSKVREQEDFQAAFLRLDCVTLWRFIRQTHLTHVFGAGDPMAEVNVQEQEQRYAAMRQGDREYISTFKKRFDQQVQANEGAGVLPITESRRALDFIMRLDTKRYHRMLSQMRNDALREAPEAYPQTLAAAFRIASGWTGEGTSGGSTGYETHSAFLADTAYVKSSIPKVETVDKKQHSVGSQRVCYVCGKPGHIANRCAHRKYGQGTGTETALITDGEYDKSDVNEWNTALVMDGKDEQEVKAQDVCLFSKHEVLLDNEASLSVFSNSELLVNMRQSRRTVTMKGVQNDKEGVRISTEGDFMDTGTVYFSDKSSANILSFASQIDNGADISYDKRLDQFVMQPRNSGTVYIFGRKNIEGSEGRFYICDVRDILKNTREDSDMAMVQTVTENIQHFTKREVEGARRAVEMRARMGFPSLEKAISLVRSGKNFDVCERDFRIAESIWGPDAASLQGKTKKMRTPQASVEVGPMLVQEQQVLSVDIMFIEKIPILIGVAHPLDLTMASDLRTIDLKRPSRAATSVKRGIETFILALRSRNFQTPLIMSDGEGAIGKLTRELGEIGIEIDVSGAGGHVPRVERKIQTVKSLIRTFMAHHLPYCLSILGVIMCVMFCVSRLNMQVSSTRPQGPSPREAFTGIPPDGKRDYRGAYGDYCHATVPETTSGMTSRTEECIFMMPTGNRTGSVKMLSLHTGRIITRDQFRIMPMPEHAVRRLNQFAAKDGRSHIHSHTQVLGGYSHHPQYGNADQHLPTVRISSPVVDEDPMVEYHEASEYESRGELADELPPMHTFDKGDHENDSEVNRERPESRGDPVNNDEESMEKNDREPGAGSPAGEPDGSATEDKDSSGSESTMADADHRTGTAESDTVPEETGPISNRRLLDFFRHGGSDRLMLTSSATATLVRQLKRTENWVDKEYAMTISVQAALREHGEVAREVIMAELRQMVDRKVWRPKTLNGMTRKERRGIIRSSMFVKEKFLSTGMFEKLKARLVAGGDQQEKGLYEDLSAPTVSTSAVFAVLAIAGAESRETMVIDIGGAFLHADMEGEPVYMRLDKVMAGMMVEIDPSYGGYVDEKGCIVVVLDKALYGCVQSASLWYENLRRTMERYGFVRNAHDQCVFNMTGKDGKQCTVTIHVDDLLVTCASRETMNGLADHLKRTYCQTCHDKYDCLVCYSFRYN